jgi:hypothetical protein
MPNFRSSDQKERRRKLIDRSSRDVLTSLRKPRAQWRRRQPGIAISPAPILKVEARNLSHCAGITRAADRLANWISGFAMCQAPSVRDSER